MILYHFTDDRGLAAIMVEGRIQPNYTPTWPLTGQTVVYLTTNPLPGWCCHSSRTGFHGSVRFAVEVPDDDVVDPWARPPKHPTWLGQEVEMVRRSQSTHRVMYRPVVEDELISAQDVHTGERWWHDTTGRGRTDHIDPHEPGSLLAAKLRYLAELAEGFTTSNPSPWNTPR